jgi:hypothetical protein
MANPWLSIPLCDYEAHMGSAKVRQLGALSELFAEALRRCRPESAAIGAPGNGDAQRSLLRGGRRLVLVQDGRASQSDAANL